MTDLAVIMSVYLNDRLAFVRESVESILSQTFSNFHYFIVFDGPVAKDVDEYIGSLQDERIRHFTIDKNGGLAAALNFLLEKVLSEPSYEYIARMDADDVSLPGRFEKQRSFLFNNPDVTVLGSWYEEIDEEGKHLSYRKLPTGHEELRKRYYTRTPFAHSSVMYRRRLIEVAGYYPTDTVLMEDNVLWGRALYKGLKFDNIPEKLHEFRIDNRYFSRRSGLDYGLNFINQRRKISTLISSPAYAYFVLLIAGMIKIMPSFIKRGLFNMRRICVRSTDKHSLSS